MNITLDQMEIFVAAAASKSFSDTARRLRKTQSRISTAIIDLEMELGVRLFDRSGRYPVLTPAGESLLAEAEAVLLHCGSLKDRASALTSKVGRSATIAVEDAFPVAQIAPVLESFRARFPEIRLDFLQPNQEELVDMVLKGEAMLGLGCARANYPLGVGFARLGNVTFANVARRDHPLALNGRVRFATLGDHLQLVLHPQTRHLLTSEYLKSPRQWRVGSQAVLLDLLKRGLGWAIVPKRLIGEELASGELIELTLEAYPHTQWTIGLDLTWSLEARPGIASAWLKAELSRCPIFS